MKKIICVFAVLAGIFVFSTSAVAFLFNDGVGASYNCADIGSAYLDNTIYTCTVTPAGSGFVIYNTTYNTFTVKVLRNENWFSYSQEGDWTGCGSIGYNANSAGGLFQVTISCGAGADDGGDGSGNSNIAE